MFKIKTFLANANQALKFFKILSKKDNPFNSPAFGDYSKLGNKTFRGTKDQLDAYESLAWVSIALDRIMRDTGGQEMFFTDMNSGEVIDFKDIPEEILLPFKNGFGGNSFLGGLLANAIGHRALTGNAYFLKYKSSAWAMLRESYDQFIPLLPHRVKPVISRDYLAIERYDFSLNGTVWYSAKPEDIIHFKQNCLFNSFIGVGNITKMRLTAEGETASEEFNNEFMGRMAAPSLIIKDKQDYDQPAYERKLRMMREAWEGKANAGKLMLLTGDGVDAMTLNIPQKDMQYLEIKKFSRETILGIFGVPPIMAGIVENANRANSIEQRLMYLGNTANPILGEIEEIFNSQHVWKIESGIRLNFRRHITGDMMMIKDMIANGIISPNRAAELLGEEADWNDQARSSYYLPVGFMPIDMAGQVEPAAPPKGFSPDDGKPYPNEHAARLTDPDKYDEFRREKDFFYKKSKKDKDKGIDVIWGIILKPKRKSEMQAIRFKKDKWTVAEAKAWLKAHDFEYIEFEPASEKRNYNCEDEILNNLKNIDEIIAHWEKKLRPTRRFQLNYFRAALKRRNRMEDNYFGQIEDYLEGQEKRIMAKIRDIKFMSLKLRAEGKSADDIVNFIFDYDAENAEYKKTIIKLHTAGVQGAIADINTLAGVYVSASMSNPFVKQAINRLARQSIEFHDKAGHVYGVNRTAESQLYKIVSEAMSNFASTPEMTEKIRAYLEEKVPAKLGEQIPWRARMIARTESRAAWDAGAVVNYKDIGVKTCDVIGCTQFEPDSDCGATDVPIDKAGSLSFHPNHLGCIVPSEIPV